MGAQRGITVALSCLLPKRVVAMISFISFIGFSSLIAFVASLIVGSVHSILLIDTSRKVCDRVYVTIRCLSVCPSVPSCVAGAACGGFAAVGPAGRRYRSIAARRVD